jgi:hypothetical protein
MQIDMAVQAQRGSKQSTLIFDHCRGVTRMTRTPGCALSGFVLVKKVPGALHFLAKSPGHSFDYAAMNMSHVVNYLYFGNKPSPRRHQVCLAMCDGKPLPSVVLLRESRCAPTEASAGSFLDVCLSSRVISLLVSANVHLRF